MSNLNEIDASVFLEQLAREVLANMDVVEPGTTFTPQGDKVVYDNLSGISVVYCREYPNDPVVIL
jgi:hypothetical protein